MADHATDTDLQAIAATGWGFTDRELLGGWELRAAGGFTSRANSAWPLGDAGRPVAEALTAVVKWYRDRDLTPQVQTVVGSELDRQLTELGHRDAVGHSVRQTADVAEALAALTRTADPGRHAELSTELPEDFLTVYRRGLGHPHSPAVLEGGTGASAIRFAVVRDVDGSALAVGRVAVNAAERWAGLAAIHTAERARRRGLSRIVLRDLLAVAAEAGAIRVYLEVEADNVAARTLYESLGFATAHAYHCRLLG